jgi:hypothetical protein
MLIDARKIDDFKTERKDLLPPLPMIFRLVPLLFYLSIVFFAVVGSVGVWHSRVAQDKRLSLVNETAALQNEIEQTKAARGALDEKTLEAMDLENWVLGSMPMQPLVVEIVRSIGENSSIANLSLERDTETPSQLKLALTLRTDSDAQLDTTLKAIRGLNYIDLSPTQSMVQGNLEYRATLLRNDRKDGKSPTPEERREEIQQQ